VAFNGKIVYEQFAQRKCNFGLQKANLYGAQVYVLPSTSGQNARGKSDRLKALSQACPARRTHPERTRLASRLMGSREKGHLR